MNSRYIDAEPTRQHILALLAAGITTNRISQRAGMTHWDIQQFVKGDRTRGRQRRISPARAARILAIDLAAVTPSLVDATGTRRRIEALTAAGWPMERLAEHFGVSLKYVAEMRKQDKVRDVSAQAVTRAYEQLKDKRPETRGVIPPIAKRARRMAADRGWAPPKYWAKFPDAIDDPHFTPEYGMTRPQRLAEEAVWLVTVAGVPRTEAATRLGLTFGEVDEALAYAAAA
ncbi:hypothetical protein [Streptomyces goshikiensis]|uniref:hypothetical protein n=1 Tax=Streptomyces goshikiensis TaxID=1942 RepID=UPI00370F81E4